MTDRARAAVVAAIVDHGPITFAEFMELALYGSGGFYEHPPVGPAGHYVTSPHVHPIFGALLALGIRDLWERLERPDPFRLVDVGAGDGTLARQLVRELSDVPIHYTAVEGSAAARATLTHIDRVEAVTELPETADLVLAHELLDNLPFRVVRGAHEIRVGIDGDRLVEVEVPADASLRRFVADEGEEPGEVIVPVDALRFVDRVAGMLRPGYALIIDYGDEGGRTGGDRHGYRAHRVVEDVISDPGNFDITAGVDFSVIARRALARGLRVHPTVSQTNALSALGFEAWALDQRSRQRSALNDGRGREAVDIWSARSRASLLVDQTALGRHRWLLLSSRELPCPSWIRRASGGPG